MYTRSPSAHENAPPSHHPRARRSRAAAQPGAVAAAPAAARLRSDAGDDFTRHQGSRPGQTVGRRRLPAARRRSAQPGDRAQRARTRRQRLPAQRRAGPAARRRAHRPRPGAAARGGARPRPAARSRRHDRRRRHHPAHRARRARRRVPRQAAEGLRHGMTDTQRASPARVVLAHSGHLDAAAAIPWLAAQQRAEVVAVTIDLGQKKEWLEGGRDRALAGGCVRAHVVDVRDEFARDYLARGLKAGLLGPDSGASPAALATPLVARTLVSIARIEEEAAGAHAAPAGDTSAIARTVRVLNPALVIVSVPALFRTAEESGAAGSRTPAATTEPAFVDIAIERGVPVGVNGVAMPWPDLIGSLQIIARAHALGPSALGLVEAAHRALRGVALSSETERFGDLVAAEYRRMLADGSWFSPMRPALDAYVDTLQQTVGGTVRLKLFNGTCTVVDTHLAAAAPATIIPVAKAHR